MRLNELFRIHNARSAAFKSHAPGDVAFVTNGLVNNGIQGYVAPLRKDTAFDFDGLCVSAFCEATVQKAPFIARGNGGSGLVILEPLRDLSKNQLIFYAAFINKILFWRFSFGRMVTKDRIELVEVPEIPESIPDIDLIHFLPSKEEVSPQIIDLGQMSQIKISSIFEIKSGDYHAATAELNPGTIPLISCGEIDNGIVGFFDVPPENQYSNYLTVAYNGKPLTTYYHPYTFGAKDDVAVCIPINSLPLSTVMYIQGAINREAWRFSYGRKCFKEKLTNTTIVLPVREDGHLNHEVMKRIVTQTSYWNYLERKMSSSINPVDCPLY